MTIEKKGKIVVLLTDTPNSETSHKYGDYADQGITLLKDTPQLANYELIKYDVLNNEDIYPTREELASGEIKGVYITGSKFDSFGPETWIKKLADFIRLVYNEYSGIPITGVCFGHQIIALALGVPTIRNPKGWEFGVTTVKTNPEIQKSIQKFPSTFNIVEVHQDIATGIPPNTTLIGSTETCEVQGFYQKGKLLTFQGHPEFNTDCCQIIAESQRKKEKISQEFLGEITNRNNKLSNDQSLLGDIMADFLIDV